MKQFVYKWTEEFFLLHIELNNTGNDRDYDVGIYRKSRTVEDSTESVKKGTISHRFMLSRSHPAETELTITYPDDVVLKAFELDDRAYYPTQPFFVG